MQPLCYLCATAFAAVVYACYLLCCRVFLLFVGEEAYHEEQDDNAQDGEDAYLDVVAELIYGGIELVGAYYRAKSVAYEGENGVPYTCTYGGVEDELAEVHAGKTGGDRDKLAHNCYKTAYKSRYDAVLVEELLGSLYLA